MLISQFTIYLIPLLLLMLIYIIKSKLQHRQNHQIKTEAIESGLLEPASLHPVIDPNRCIGCGSCTFACPEHRVLGLIYGKAELINPSHCIGHGACKTACPLNAITLVFGTEKRGVDIPFVSPTFETNVPGIFIAGELGGMGLIRNAIEQGKQAMDSIRKKEGISKQLDHDVVIVGSGPAGIASSLSAMKHKLRFITVEQDSLGGTVAHFPRGKIVMTAPVDLPIVGKVKFTETTKEKLLELWTDIVNKTGLLINFNERVEKIEKIENGFLVKTTKNEYMTVSVLLTIGRRGTPRMLGAEGENLNKVVYRLIDPEQYRGKNVLVVGGGDSALEAATSIANLEGNNKGSMVTLSYRSEAFSRAKEKNRVNVQKGVDAGKLNLLMKSNVIKIDENIVKLVQEGTLHELKNDAVIVCAGGILPTQFLKDSGVEVETKYGTA